MNDSTLRATTLAALALAGCSAACSSTPRADRGLTVLRSEHLEVKSLPPRAEADDATVLPLLHVACAPGDRLLALEVVIWDDVDGNGRRSPAEACDRWAMPSGESRAESMEWRGMRLPPGDALRAELDATLERHGRFEGTWRVSVPEERQRSRYGISDDRPRR
ncbi:MAG: hypothetical protein H6831_15340 [Planctomycetes bacterium]|nr:hypothetical protein [Planctomycetota bacterium]MCB9905772.1 hypothetical protein [Planctomycetota bacterium]